MELGRGLGQSLLNKRRNKRRGGAGEPDQDPGDFLDSDGLTPVSHADPALGEDGTNTAETPLPTRAPTLAQSLENSPPPRPQPETAQPEAQEDEEEGLRSSTSARRVADLLLGGGSAPRADHKPLRRTPAPPDPNRATLPPTLDKALAAAPSPAPTPAKAVAEPPAPTAPAPTQAEPASDPAAGATGGEPLMAEAPETPPPAAPASAAPTPPPVKAPTPPKAPSATPPAAAKPAQKPVVTRQKAQPKPLPKPKQPPAAAKPAPAAKAAAKPAPTRKPVAKTIPPVKATVPAKEPAKEVAKDVPAAAPRQAAPARPVAAKPTPPPKVAPSPAPKVAAPAPTPIPAPAPASPVKTALTTPSVIQPAANAPIELPAELATDLPEPAEGSTVDRAARVRARLGRLLAERGQVTPDQLTQAVAGQKRSGGLFGDVLVGMGFVPDRVLADALAEVIGIPRFSRDTVPDPEVMDVLPLEERESLRVLPLGLEDGELTVAMADPENVVARDSLLRRWPRGTKLTVVLATETELRVASVRGAVPKVSLDAIVAELDQMAGGSPEPETDGPGTAEPGLASTAAAGHPVARLIDSVLADAVRKRASDIHFEPEGRQLRIRLRIDGVLWVVRSLNARHWPAVSARLKQMASMTVDDHQTPQQGRFSYALGTRALEVRVSSLPTVDGENVVLRLLDRTATPPTIASLGFADSAVANLKRLSLRPEGLIIACGPTGSGTTTTLYALLDHLSGDDINIMTIEDPVEYEVPLVRQTQLDPKGKMTYADGIAAILRQDPDILMVGEVRDPDTAAMALRAAMTGHRVLTTLHANDAVGAIPRLIDLGLRPGMLAGNLIAVVAQRLVRRLCTNCRGSRPADEVERRILGATGDKKLMVGTPKGCSHCGGTGFRGRVAITEILPITPDLDSLIADGAPMVDLRSEARKAAPRSLADDGLRRVLEGDVTVADLARAVDVSARLA